MYHLTSWYHEGNLKKIQGVSRQVLPKYGKCSVETLLALRFIFNISVEQAVCGTALIVFFIFALICCPRKMCF